MLLKRIMVLACIATPVAVYAQGAVSSTPVTMSAEVRSDTAKPDTTKPDTTTKKDTTKPDTSKKNPPKQ